jgi:WD40 repeat protein
MRRHTIRGAALVVACLAIFALAASRGDAQQPHVLSESRFYGNPAFSPDGKLLATLLPVEASSNPALPAPESGEKKVSRIDLWNVATMKSVRTLGGQVAREGHNSRQLAFSPDGTLLALAEMYGRVRLWDTATWQESTLAAPRSVPARKTGRTTSREPTCGEMAFSADSRRLAVCYICAESRDNCVVRVWDLASRTMQGALDVEGHPQHVSYFPDGRLAVVVLFAGGVRKKHTELQTWNTETFVRVARYTLSDQPLVGCFSPDGTLLAAARHKQIVLYDCRTGQAKPLAEIREINANPQAAFSNEVGVTSLAFSGDGQLLAAAGNADQTHNRLELWDLSLARRADAYAPIEHGPGYAVVGLSFSPHDRHLATVVRRFGQAGATLYLWDLAGGSKSISD